MVRDWDREFEWGLKSIEEHIQKCVWLEKKWWNERGQISIVLCHSLSDFSSSRFLQYVFSLCIGGHSGSAVFSQSLMLSAFTYCSWVSTAESCHRLQWSCFDDDKAFSSALFETLHLRLLYILIPDLVQQAMKGTSFMLFPVFILTSLDSDKINDTIFYQPVSFISALSNQVAPHRVKFH